MRVLAERGWGCYGWAGSLALAQKAVATWRNRCPDTRDFQAIACTMTTKTVQAADPTKKLKAQLTREAGWISKSITWHLPTIVSQFQTGKVEWSDSNVNRLVDQAVRSAHAGRQRLAMDEAGGAQ